MRQQAEVLEDHREPVPAQLAQRARALALRMSSPSRSISPVVGSISRVRQRTRVDLPLPGQAHDDEDLAGLDVEGDVLDGDRPAVSRGRPRRSARAASASAGVGASLPSAGPKTFQRSRTAIVGWPEPAPAVAADPGAAVASRTDR